MTVRVGLKTPFSFSPPTSKSSYIAAEVLTQCLQSEYTNKNGAMQDDFEVGGENEMGVFRHTLTVMNREKS